MYALDIFTDKLKDEPSLRQWLLEHIIEVERFLDSRYSEVSDQEYNLKKFMFNPLLGFLLTKDAMMTNQQKVDRFLEYVRDNSFVATMIGRKGYGKTAFTSWVAEELHLEMPICWFDVNYALPKYFKIVLDWDEIEDGSLVGVDEAGLTYLSRDAMTREAKDMSKLLMISRHRGLKIFFMSQAMALSDINIWRLSDCFIIKPLQLMDVTDAESTKTKMFFKYIVQMQPRSKNQTLFTTGDEWMLFENPLPTFWSEEISKGYRKLGYEEAVAMAKKMVESGMAMNMIKAKLKARGSTMSEAEIRAVVKMKG